jgi:hypothetical protein
MIELLGVSRHELPPMIEHVEAVVAGMWVRTKVGAVHRDPVTDRMFLQTLLSAGHAQNALKNHVERATRRGIEPVVVIVEPDDRLGAVLDQMTAEDVLIVAHADTENVVGRVALYGPRACRADDAHEVTDNPELRAMAVDALTQAHAGGSLVVQLHPFLSRRAG